MIFMSSLQVDNSVLFSTVITIAAFTPLFPCRGGGPDLRPDGPHLWLRAGRRADRHLHRHAGAGQPTCCRAASRSTKPASSSSSATPTSPRCAGRSPRAQGLRAGVVFLLAVGVLASRLGSEFLPALEEGNLWIRASMPPTISLEAGTAKANRMREIIKSYPR
jgi:cobalt-zinc-cadmium resistance protein CzcA